MNEMMSSGVELMITGMGIVYLFLAMLVVAIKTMTVIVARYFPDPTALAVTIPKQDNDPQVIAAISAAIHQYRSKNSSNLS